MANMQLDTYTFAVQPSTISMFQKDKSAAVVQTYNSVGYFSWGTTIVGKQILCEWNYMPSTQFASIDTLYQNDNEIVFDPQDGTGTTYNVEILDFDGKYFQGVLGTGTYRKDVKMVLVIMSEV